eukprot:c7694_g1_i1.p1 GENE.c7694_g1_i1~~c7694_g1_i1.p1  ORF type:complete len:574 (+),score=135.93 c7694_g1_i1:30-1751(+)
MVLLSLVDLCFAASSIEQRFIEPLKSKHRHDELVLLSIAMIVIGVGMTFFGLRFLKIVLFICGFLSGFIASFFSANSFMDSNPALWGLCFAVGFVGGMITFCFEKVGKAAIGGIFALLLAFVAHLAILHFIPDSKNTTTYVIVALACVAGCFVGLKAHKYVLMVMTSLLGGYGIVCGIDMLTKNQLSFDHVKNHQLDALGWSLLALWVVFGIAGTFFQGCFKCRGRKCCKTAPVPSYGSGEAHPPHDLGRPLVASHNGPMLSAMYATPTRVQVDPAHSGFVNMGNTCFMNASMQALYAVTPLRNYLLNAKRLPDGMTGSVASVFNQLSTTSSPSIQPREFSSILSTLDFADGRQHDAFEFTMSLVNAMIDQIPTHVPNPFKSIFAFETEAIIRCDSCTNESVTREECLDLALDIPFSTAPVPLENLMSEYFKATRFTGEHSYQCDHCNQLTDATRSLHVAAFPETMIVSLNRFRYSPRTQSKQKLMTQILVPSNILVSSMNFSLEAVVVHSGFSTDAGHYYAFVRLGSYRNPVEKIWYKCDDRFVSAVTFEEVRNVLLCADSTESAYFLFYTK